ncbi:MAG: hypothetical protein P8N11_06255 [Gammaproteobacteria bacterium]|jgi:hypothetical protein|nr:hypothetical protein [Gammaproteobacteria bacterium]
MKKFKLEVWIQLIGMLSVVLGLLFVGLEMRQSKTIAIAEIRIEISGDDNNETALVTQSIE